MLTGHNPVASPFAIPPARVVNPSLSPQLEAVLLRATAHNAVDRFPTVEQFCAELRQGMEPVATGPTLQIGAPISTPLRNEPVSRPLWTPAPRTLPQRPAQGGLVRGLVLLFLFFVLAMSLGAGVWLLRGELRGLLGLLREQVTPQPRVSVQGTIVYVGPGPNRGDDLFIRTGTGVKALTNNPAGVSASLPALSPDGSRIAYGIFKKDAEGNSTEELWIVDRDGAN